MPEITTFEIITFLKYLGLSIVYAFILSWVINKYSSLLGDKSQYSIIFPLLIPTMVLVISVIKSSLALSLGLVGALSIIRFRTPIKDPEELTYLFVAIAIGLGLGAGQVAITSICFVVLCILLILLSFKRKKQDLKGVFLDIEIPLGKSEKLTLAKLTETIKTSKIACELRRFEEHDKGLSATYYLEPTTLAVLDQVTQTIQKLKKEARFAVINKNQLLG
ncbi:DUF4956 domain-containing protein [bacterium]|nr:DUF4956 domain-containing protein [bacterium]